MTDQAAGGPVDIDARTGTVRRLLLERRSVVVRTLPDLRRVRTIDDGGHPHDVAFTRRGDRATVTTGSSVALLH